MALLDLKRGQSQFMISKRLLFFVGDLILLGALFEHTQGHSALATLLVLA